MSYGFEFLKRSDGVEVAFHHWIPECDKSQIKTVVILSHGMAEHAFRYDRFAKLLNNNNIAFYAEDHRGHGKTAEKAKNEGTGDFGVLAKKDGFFRVVEDIHEEVLYLKKEYPESNIVLFGHSFGSFITQCFIEKYGNEISKVVICGTAGPRKMVVAGASLAAKLTVNKKNQFKPHKFLDSAAFGAYNNKIKNPKTKVDWLSRDEAEVQKYINDPWCGFMCSGSFFRDLFAGLTYIHQDKNISSIPVDLPVLFIDGTGDPVGDYSKTVKKLYEIYVKKGIKKVDLKLYDNARHELLNEINRDQIENDVLKWIIS